MRNPIKDVYDSSIKFLVPLSPEATYRVIIQEAMRLVKGDVGSIILEQNKNLRRVYSTSPSLFNIKPRKKGYTYKVYEKKEPLILGLEKISKVHPQIEKTGIKSDALVPLLYKNKSMGVLSILSKRKHFDKDDISTLSLLGPLASLAIRKAQLYDELNKALRTRNLFISMASHELKTPVTTVYTYLQILKTKTEKGEPFDSKWIDNLLEEMVRLTRLINELLEVNQIKTGQLKYSWEEVNLRKVIKRTVSSFRTTHKKSRVYYRDYLVDDDVNVVGDPDKLLQVFMNLLDNSSKHSNGKPMEISLKTNKKSAIVTVEDQGEGIPKEDMMRIFDEFYKGKTHTKAGLGLGLFIIKQIVDSHKGKIEIKSAVNKGTTAKVSLPLLKI